MCTSSLRLLSVDDYRDGADAFAVLQRLHGHEVEVCYSGAEAMLVASEFRPDVIFLDICMPDLDGCDVANFVRQSPSLADCVLVAVSGYSRPADRERCLEAGFDYFLVKPADPDTIEEILAEVSSLSLCCQLKKSRRPRERQQLA